MLLIEGDAGIAQEIDCHRALHFLDGTSDAAESLDVAEVTVAAVLSVLPCNALASRLVSAAAHDVVISGPWRTARAGQSGLRFRDVRRVPADPGQASAVGSIRSRAHR
jgi:hypothetical protein